MKDEPKFKVIDRLSPAIVAFGRYYNGFEIMNLENLPLDRPVVVVFYHGLLPLDVWYAGLQIYLKTGVLIRALVDRWLFKTPGLGFLVRACGGISGDPMRALKLLQSGQSIGVSPGGVREAISGAKNNYKLVWRDRVGFAKVALAAQVDIVPVFTENVEEMYRAPMADHKFFQKVYEITRLPLVPIVGLGVLPFPVKLRTWIGKPIPYDPADTPESLRDKTAAAIEALIREHQDVSGGLRQALRARVRSR
jgi:1-acyl-sn-glycerol-3-phosphate acyltransferase